MKRSCPGAPPHNLPCGGEGDEGCGREKKQTVFLTGVNAVVRALGLLLRVMLSRAFWVRKSWALPELAQGVHMLAITPLTSGIPMAISRMTARPKDEKQKPAARGHFSGAGRICGTDSPPCCFFPLLARWMGDVRVLPSLWFSAPCILILGYSAAFNGYCYGMERSLEPAMSELIEQAARLDSFFFLLTWLSRLTAAWLLQLCRWLPHHGGGNHRVDVCGLRGCIPCTAPRRCRLARARAAPCRARHPYPSGADAASVANRHSDSHPASGERLPAAEATARLGMLNGMVMPLLMLPCVFTSALSMVALPRIAKAEDDPRELKRLILTCLGSCLPVALGCTALVYLPLAGSGQYRLPYGGADPALFRMGAPLTALFAVSHLIGAVSHRAGAAKALHVWSGCGFRHDAG